MSDKPPFEDRQGGVARAKPPIPTAVPCHKCGKPIDTTNTFCPHCGAGQKTGTAWYYQPVWIAVLAFVALGPFALPLVWKSKQMGGKAKLVMTALILAYTAYCGYFLYKIVAIEMRMFNDLNKVLRHR